MRVRSQVVVATALLWCCAAAQAERYTIPLFLAPGAGGDPQGVLRVVNDADAPATVSILAVDDAGVRTGPATLTLNASAAVQLSATELQSANASRGLASGLGRLAGHVRLVLDSDLPVVPSAYVRAADGTLSAMHDTVRTASIDTSGRYRSDVPVFNPSTEVTQVSRLRLINPGDTAASVTIGARDDGGAVATGGDVTLTLPAGGAKTLTAQQLEAGDADITGRLGAGAGKWRLTVSSDRPLQVVNVVASAAGYWNNLSTTAVPGAAPVDAEAFGMRFVDGAIVYEGRAYRGAAYDARVRVQPDGRFTETWVYDGAEATYTGRYGYEPTGTDAGRFTLTYSGGAECRGRLYFGSPTAGWLAWHCTESSNPDGYWLGGNWSVEPDDDADGGGDVTGTAYGVDDTLPGIPTSGTFVPNRLSGDVQLQSSGSGTSIVFGNGALMEHGGSRYTCTSASGCAVENGRVTRGAFARTAAGTDATGVSGDHGDDRAAATAVDAGSNTEGVLESGDVDYFRVVVDASGTLEAYTSGGIDTRGWLEDADGAVLGTNDDGGAGTNFRISEDVTPGTYFVRVAGYSSRVTGGYTLHVRFTESDSGTGTDDRTALMALYNATDGPNWTNNANWGSDSSLDSWHGVTTDNSGRVIWIDLEDNQLSGSIPPELGGLDSLGTLWLDENQLSGSIPPELGGLASLQYLTLNGNQLSGPIPAELERLASLQGLFLNGNQLSGSIPPELGGLDSLETLWLHQNQLSGSIPAELGGLDSLQEMHLDGNQLSGSIPAELGGLASLQSLWLDDNQLSGPIPAELGNLPNLDSLYLGDNRLSGCIPDGLRDVADNDLSTLGLSYCGGNGASPSFTGVSGPGNRSYTVGTAIATLTLPAASGGDGPLTYSLSPEVPGLIFNATASVRALTGTPSRAGTYDMTYRVRDTDGDTDSLNFTITVTEPASEPDLAVESVSVSDSSPEAGASFTLSATVRNRGEGRSGSTTLRYYRSSNATISRSDTQVGTDSVSGLSGSGTSAESISLTASSSAGTYYYGACVDSVTGESDTDNNCSAGVRVTVTSGETGGGSDTSPSFAGVSRPGNQSYTVGTAIATLTLPEASGGDGALTYSLTPAVPGLSFNATASVRQLTGTPSTAGSWAMTYRVTDEDGDTDTLDFTIAVRDDTSTDGALGDCQVGMQVRPGESCTYPGTALLEYPLVFSVDSSGNAVLRPAAGSPLLRFPQLWQPTARGGTISEGIDAYASYDVIRIRFLAQGQADGSWLLEIVGD